MSAEKAVRAAQGILSAANPSLVIDGKWGSFTNGTYVGASPTTRSAVDAVLKAFNTSATELYQQRQVQKAAGAEIKVGPSGRWVPESQMRTIVKKVALETGTPEDTLWKFLELEAPSKVINGVRSFDAHVRNSLGYSGLFQFDRRGDAWSDARRFEPRLGPFEQWKDPYQNTLAAAAYLKFNTLTIRRLGYKGPITGNIAYLMHNQGAGGAYKILSGVAGLAGNQSKAAIKVAAAARADARNFA